MIINVAILIIHRIAMLNRNVCYLFLSILAAIYFVDNSALATGNDTKTWSNYNTSGKIAYAQGQYHQAEEFFLAALKRAETGDNSSSLRTSLDNLAATYDALGDYRSAGQLYSRSLSLSEKEFGINNIKVVPVIVNLAFLCQEENNFDQSELLYKRALAINEKEFGYEHPTVADVCNYLAWLYQKEGNAVQAEQMYRRAIAIDSKAFGPNDKRVQAIRASWLSLTESSNDAPVNLPTATGNKR